MDFTCDYRSLYHIAASASIVIAIYLPTKKLAAAVMIAVAVGLGKEFVWDGYAEAGDIFFNMCGIAICWVVIR